MRWYNKVVLPLPEPPKMSFSIKNLRTPPVSHSLDSPLTEGAFRSTQKASLLEGGGIAQAMTEGVQINFAFILPQNCKNIYSVIH